LFLHERVNLINGLMETSPHSKDLLAHDAAIVITDD